MPGIFGLVDKTAGLRRRVSISHSETFKTMASVLTYESFYQTKQHCFEDLGVYAGWVGQDTLSSNAIVDRQDGLSLFISGKPYCEAGDDTEIVNEGPRKGDENLRIISHYSCVGDSFPEKINGLFSGFLIDKRHKQCYLFNDRFGVERLFLYEDDDRVVFSSEAKAILAVIPETRSFDPEGLGQFLACGCTLGENSLFRKIRVLPVGSVLKFVKGKPQGVRKYFNCSAWEELEPLQEKEFLTRFCETLKVVVNRYLKRPSSVAVSLTGGLDSRMIMSCLETPAGTVPCYTFGSRYRETYDVKVARRVAGHCSQPHKVLVLGEEFLSNFQDYLNKAILISDGFLGFSGAAELYLNSLARATAPLRITGNYGGELLRGVRAFKSSIPNGEFLKPEQLACVRKATQKFHRMNQMKPISFSLFVQAPSGYGRYSIERSQVTVLSPFLDNSLVELIYRKPSRFDGEMDTSYAVINKYNPDLLTIPTDRGLLGIESWPVKTARHLFRETMFKLEYWVGDGMPDCLARVSRYGLDTLCAHLFTGRHKFQHFRTWMQRELAGCMRELLLGDFRTDLDEHIDFSRVKKMLLEHLGGKRNFGSEIDMVATLVLTERLLLQHGQNQ